jgi:RNA polymerase sigma-70 factor (ECF subfamily)
MQSRFATTSWSQVVAAREAPSSESRRALDVLCRTYWYPVYAYVRRHVGNATDAGDLTQSYFAELLEKSYLDDYDRDRGRFRVFLKTSVKHFLSKQREKSESWKRGGQAEVFSLDARDGEGRYLHEPADQPEVQRQHEISAFTGEVLRELASYLIKTTWSPQDARADLIR